MSTGGELSSVGVHWNGCGCVGLYPNPPGPGRGRGHQGPNTTTEELQDKHQVTRIHAREEDRGDDVVLLHL